MKRQIKTRGQASRQQSGYITVFGGKMSYDAVRREWCYDPGSGDEDLARLSDLFSDLAPGDGPVDVEIIIRRKHTRKK